MTSRPHLCLLFALILSAACSADDTPASTSPVAPLRPGVKDSSRAFQGTASANETAFWESVRNGDDAARAKAVEELRKDAAADSTNAYSAFLAGANAFIAPTKVLLALNAGQVPEGNNEGQPPPDTLQLLATSTNAFTDPLYKGFAAALLSATQAGAGDFESSRKSMAIGVANNIPASAITSLVGSLVQKDIKGAEDSIWMMMDFCTGAPLDRTSPDIDTYVDRANKSDLKHRECFSGYHAEHATEGTLLIAGDLAALNGNATSAARMYAGMKRAKNFGTWGLRALAERRIAADLKAVPENMLSISACSSCHVDQAK